MALRAVVDHPKFSDLKARLGVPKHVALGILESLWHFAGRYTPQGNIGKYTDAAIESWIEWPGGQPGSLIQALVDSKWLDRDSRWRVLVHDWPIHADKATKQALNRAKLAFCVPTVHTPGAHNSVFVPTVHTPGAHNSVLSALPVPEPVPVPESGPEPGTRTACSALPLEELEEAWDRHQNYPRSEPKNLAFSRIVAMNGEFNVERFRENHPPWCEYWARQGWNSFGSLSFLGWIEAGMPMPPPLSAKEKKNRSWRD